MDIFILAGRRSLKWRDALFIRQIDDPLVVFLEARDLSGLALDPLPLDCLVQQMGKRGQLPERLS